MLADSDENVRNSALQTLTAFLAYSEFNIQMHNSLLDCEPDDTRGSFATPAMRERILAMLEDERWHFRNSALRTLAAFSEHGESKYQDV
jgi:hypothetical protein